MVLYLIDSLASGSNHLSLQQDGSPPTTARISTGWIVAQLAAGRYARMDSQTERASAAHTTTVQPNGGPDNTLGDCFRTDLLTGSFASGDWSFSFQVQGESRATSTHDGRLRIRIWRSANQDGSGATEITGTTQVTSSYTDLANSASQTITLTHNPGAFSLTNEYLFIQVAHEITGAGNNNNSDTHLCVGSSNSITTTAFSEVFSLGLQDITVEQPAATVSIHVDLGDQDIVVEQPDVAVSIQVDLDMQDILLEQFEPMVNEAGGPVSPVRWARTSGYITHRRRHTRRIVLN